MSQERQPGTRTLDHSPSPNWACLLTFQKGAPRTSGGLHDPTGRRGTERAPAGRQSDAHAQAVRQGFGASGLGLSARAPVSLPSPRAPGSVTHYSKGLDASRAAPKLSGRPGWSQPAAPRLQGAGQCRLSGQGPRPRHAAPGDLGGRPTHGPCPCPSPAPWSASPAAGASACARVFKPPAGEPAKGGNSSEIGPPPRARAAGSGRRLETPREHTS